MSDQFDVAILGAGPAGEHAADALIGAGRRVALIERELIGGECSNWACIPSKTLLRPAEVRAESERAAGINPGRLDWPALDAYRDDMTSAGDDSSRVAGYEARGAEVIRGDGRIAGPGTLEVDGRTIRAEHILISTGSDPLIPPIDGLADAGYWTNREATTLHEIPRSVVVVGGGPVGVELAQFLRRFGSQVALVQGAPRLAEREDPQVGERLLEALRADGIDVHAGVQAQQVRRDGADRVVTLDDGSELRGQELLIAAGRQPRGREVGLEALGVRPGPRGEVPIDEHCRVTDGVWAAGDCTGTMLFTHVAKYQARVAMADMAGRPAAADYRAIPRVIFTDPEVAAVGLTEAQARESGRPVLTSSLQLNSVPRAYTYEREPRGAMGLIADPEQRVLLGAWAVGPLCSEWIHQAVLAIRAQVPLDILLETVAQFPSYSEAYLSALQALEL